MQALGVDERSKSRSVVAKQLHELADSAGASPAHLPRERVMHDPACVCPACGSTRLTRLGEDAREVLEYVPSHFKVVVHVRPRTSCRACETIIQVPAASLQIERARPPRA